MLIWESLMADKRRLHLSNLRHRIASSHLRTFHAAVLNICDRNHLALFLRREWTEQGCRSQVARCVEEMVSEGIIAWDHEGIELTELVCSCIFDQTEGAGNMLAKTGDIFLRWLAR